MSRKVVKSREGMFVDEESGEVVESSPILEYDELYDYEGRAENMDVDSDRDRFCVDDEAVERFVSQLIPGLVEILKVFLKKRLCSSNVAEISNALKLLWGSDGADFVDRILRRRAPLSAYEATIHSAAGLHALTVFRCLKYAGVVEERAFNIVDSVLKNQTINEKLYSLAKELLESLRITREEALVRWVSRPIDTPIDLMYASRVLSSEIREVKNVRYIVAKIDDIGVQITPNKIDISSRVKESDRVLSTVNLLSRRLGAVLSRPIPMIATVIVRLPFRVNIAALARIEGGELLGNRVKVKDRYWTALIYTSTINLYVNLKGIIDKIDTAIAETVPIVCTYMQSDAFE